MQITDVTFTVKWSEEDGEWVATCDKFPSMSALNRCAEYALDDLLFLVATELERHDMNESQGIKG